MTEPRSPEAAAFTPIPEFSFSAVVNLGPSIGPIPLVQGGVRVVETITGGTIRGPGFNATLQGGLAAPILVDTANGTRVQIPYIYAYGTASDGVPFYMEESGIGSGVTQNTRLTINVGGKYKDIQTKYILGQPTLNEARTVAYVDCWSVPLPPNDHHHNNSG